MDIWMSLLLLLAVPDICDQATAALIMGESMDVREEAPTPLFDSETDNITAIAGQACILPCTVKNKGPTIKVIWLNPRTTLISTDDSRHIDDTRISVERPQVQDWNLMIREVRYNDSGRYMCQINTKPVLIKNIYLSVKVPPEIIEDWESTEIEVREGSTIEIVCNATGVPMPIVTWYRQDAILTDYNQEDYGMGEHNLEGEVLRLRNITRYCEGRYECNADNGVPPVATKEFEISVRFPPEVRLTVTRIGQAVGLETVLECKVSASPHASIIWKKNGTEIDLRAYKLWIEIFDDGKHEKSAHLNIINIDYDDFGYYTCHASNALGMDSETMLLYEYKPPRKLHRKTTTTPRTPKDIGYPSLVLTPPFPGDDRYKTGEIEQPWRYNTASMIHTTTGLHCFMLSMLLSLSCSL